jgi:hypothetical protein
VFRVNCRQLGSWRIIRLILSYFEIASALSDNLVGSSIVLVGGMPVA